MDNSTMHEYRLSIMLKARMKFLIDDSFLGNSNMLGNKGFSLMELMVALAIAAIIASMAAPSFSDAIRNNRLRSSADNIYTLIRFARAEAARQGKTINVGALDGQNWSSGGVVWSEIDGVTGFDQEKDTEIKRFDVSEGVVIQENSGMLVIPFNGQGYTALAAELNFCDSRHDELGRKISVLASGFSAIANKEDCL